MRKVVPAALFAVFSFTAAAVTPSVILSGKFNQQSQATAFDVKTDALGNIYICGTAFAPGIQLVRPLQSTGGIFLMKLDPTGTSVLYATMLGAGVGDSLGGMAVDAGGNAYIVGSTFNPNLPVTTGAVQKTGAGGSDAFVLKVDPTGQRLLYSSYLGGPGNDNGLAIAVDAIGAIYVAGASDSGNFPVTPGSNIATAGKGAVFVSKFVPDGTWLQYSSLVESVYSYNVKLAVTSFTEATVLINGSTVLKLNAAGDRLVYRTVMPSGVTMSGLASDGNGYIWMAGGATLPGLSTPDAAQPQIATGAYFHSGDGGLTWTRGGLDVSSVNHLLAFGSVLYAGTEQGLFQSSDNGTTWNRLLEDPVQRIAADPAAGGTLYVLRRGVTPVAKTTDGGVTWRNLDPQAPAFPIFSGLAIDPSNPSTIYAGAAKVYRSDDGGATWTATPDALPGNGITSLAVDPSDPSIVYASLSSFYAGCGIGPCIPTTPSVMRSRDGGRTFQGSSLVNYVGSIVADPKHPGTAYATGSLLYKTIDFGAHWIDLRGPAIPGVYSFPAIAVDESGALLVLAADGVHRSEDGGQTFARLGDFVTYGTATFAVVGSSIHIAGGRGSNALVAKLDWDGKIVYATYWGGHVHEVATAITLDAGGNVYVAGYGGSPDFPSRDAPREYSGQGDAFLLKLNPAGAVLYSTFWGGSAYELATGVSAGPGGIVYFVGNTGSLDFPTAGGLGSQGPGSMFLVGMR